LFNLEAILREKNPPLAKKIPPWGMYLLRQMVHERLISSFIEVHKQKNALDFTQKALDRLGITLEIRGLENLHAAKRPMICANHPSGGLEGLGLISLLLKELGGCRIPANDILGRVPPLQPLLVPLDKKKPTRQSLETLDRVFQSDEPVLIFPAGVTARKRAGFLQEFPWQTSFITHSRRHGRDLVPVWVSGENSPWFYWIYQIRKAFSIKFNLEMVLLADELIRKKNSHLVIEFLSPISFDKTQDNLRKKDRDLARYIQKSLDALARRTHG
jgi:putative hemolysin